MLEPNSRRLLMESLQPPPNFRLDWAVGTTYSLDLMAMLSAPVAFAFSDYQDRDGKPTTEPLALLKAVRQYAKQLCLFCQGGKIHVPKVYQPLLASLEDSIFEANAPLGGSFHPKLWFLRFKHTDGTVKYRFLCLSRNMTFDRSWDTILRLEGEYKNSSDPIDKNERLGEFVESLPKMSTRGVTTHWKKRLRILAKEVRCVEFESPDPFVEMDFWPLGHDKRKKSQWPFPKKLEKMLVISPFVDDGFLSKDLAPWQTKVKLISRPDSLAQLQEKTRDGLEEIWILDDAADPEPGEAEEATYPDDGAESKNDFTETPLVGLHAKVFVVDDGRNARIFTGSANATRAGFNRNVEFMVELKGGKKRCGIDATLGNPEDNDKTQVSCLKDLLSRYVHRETAENNDEATIRFERDVDDLARRLAAAAPVSDCGQLAEPDSYSMTIQPKKKMKKGRSDEFLLRARPISLQTLHFNEVNTNEPSWVKFEPISLLGLTSFWVFEVESEKLDMKRQFVLNVPLENAPLNRQEAILRNLLGDGDQVLRFMLLLLLDNDARDFDRLFPQNGTDDPKSSFANSLFGSTLFESLMRALDKNPERIDFIAHFIKDLRQTPEGRSFLPDDLDEIWKPIWTVRQRQTQKRRKTKTNGEGKAL